MDELGETRPWRASPPTVGAVLVTHDGATWLPKVLGSFAEMDHAPTAWRVVDVSSTDDGAELARRSFGPERIVYAPSGTGFGSAVALGVEALPRTDWIWLLHDDAAVRPDTLAALLDEATSADDIAVVGPKIREWPSLRRLLDVGLTLTRTGSRETGLETGEPDAGQHDRPEDVLAVNSAGMLVRRDVWDELGGFDPQLPLHLDDVDFGWRVARAGHRTRTAPAAVLFHAEASRRGTRRRSAGDPAPWEARRAALFTLLANTSGRWFWWQYVRLLVGTLLRVLGFLVGKDPESASDELLALRSVYGRPGRLRAARRARAVTSRRGNRQIRHLFAPWWLPYRHGYDTVRDAAASVVRPESVETVGRRSSAPVLGTQSPDETEDLESGPSLWARRPWLVTVLLLTLASLVAARGLLTGDDGSALRGGALLPAPDTAVGWWGLLVERGHDVALGSTSLPPVFAGLLGAVATPVWFRPGLVVTVLVLLAAPLAGLTAHRLGRRLTSHRGPRIVWALTWAMTVVATGAVAQGRIGTLVALVVLPVIALTALQLGEQPGRRLGVKLGLWIAVGAAFAPVVLVLSLLGLVLLVVVERSASRPAALAVVVSLVLLGPWVVQRALHPTRLWWEAGRPVPAETVTALDLALGRAGGPGSAPAWLGGGLLALAVLALVPRRTRVPVQLCWAVAVTALALAVIGTFVTFSVPGSPQAITPWLGVPVAVWVLALSTAVLLAVPEAAGLPRAGVAVLAVVALVLPVGTATWWLARGVDDPLERSRAAVVPAFLAERPGDTLVLTGSVSAGVDFRAVRGTGPFLGQEALTPDRDSLARVDATLERLLARPSAPDVERLAGAGIDAIYAPRADPDLARRLDATPLLEVAGSEDPDSRVWTLVTSPTGDEPQAGAWRWALGGSQVVLWLVAVVLTAPVRRRPETETADEEVRAA